MLQRLRQAGLVWPTLLALAGLAVLIGLGTWQLERRRWKEDLLGKIAERAHAEPVSLAALLEQAKGSLPRHQSAGKGLVVTFLTIGDVDYLHVAVTGRFHHDKERYLYAPGPSGLGWHVYTPLEMASGSAVWINRGFVPDERKAPQTRLEGQPAGEVEVRGLIRHPAVKALFAPGNDPARNLWYWPDLAGLTASAFEGPQAGSVLPFVIEADARPEPPGGLPKGGVTRLSLPNRHLEYALTWYGLALTLAGVYLAFAVSRLRSLTAA